MELSTASYFLFLV